MKQTEITKIKNRIIEDNEILSHYTTFMDSDNQILHFINNTDYHTNHSDNRNVHIKRLIYARIAVWLMETHHIGTIATVEYNQLVSLIYYHWISKDAANQEVQQYAVNTCFPSHPDRNPYVRSYSHDRHMCNLQFVCVTDDIDICTKEITKAVESMKDTIKDNKDMITVDTIIPWYKNPNNIVGHVLSVISIFAK